MEIVYATDGSAGAASAGEFLARLQLTEADRILLLAVTPNGQATEADPCFRGPRALLASTKATVETEVQQGPPGDRILACARDRNANLIALGAVGHSAVTRFLMGSVSEKVVRYAQRPVLVARPRRFDYKTVLLGVDSSADAKKAVELAAQLPFLAETEFCLANVLPSRETVLGAAPLTLGALSDNLETILAGARKESEARLREMAQILCAADRKVRAEILRGDPSTALINACEREMADLLIVGTHGESGLDRFLMGNVSERVVRHAHASVLVVR
jgi:nucleotide-binding universal stress UspA family protein